MNNEEMKRTEEYETLTHLADKLGYTLIKKKPYIKRLPCTCGAKQVKTWYTPSGVMLQCKHMGCGRTAEGKNKTEAKLNWNKEIENE